MARRKRNQPLRSGYTTGACAAAAAQAATIALAKQMTVDHVGVELPQGKEVNFRVNRCVFDLNCASCSVIKDAGDDPDITNGTEICATVSWKTTPGIEIKGGKGVGVVTKPGLEVPVGMPAINPVPHQMIRHSIVRVLGSRPDRQGIQIVISVPKGEELAKRTLNSRLGILGGISILGTTGIIIPYSVNAYKASIAQGVDVAMACGCQKVVLTTGRRSENFAQRELVTLREECFIQAGDFIGYSVGECARRRLAKAIVWGMIGKISKLAARHLYTNVSDSKVDIGFLAEVAASCGVPDETINGLKATVTANHFRRMLPAKYVTSFCNQLCRLAARNCRAKTDNRLVVACVMTDAEGTILGRASAGE